MGNWSKFNKSNKSVENHLVKQSNNCIILHAQIFSQANRIVLKTIFSFDDVALYLNPMKSNPAKQKIKITNSDELSPFNKEELKNLENRYLDEKHGHEIYKYLRENHSNFVLPNISLISSKLFKIIPQIPSMNNIKKIFGDDVITDAFLTHSISEILEAVGGCLYAEIQIPKEYFEDSIIKIGDGNHRTYAIKRLVEEGCLINGAFVGIDIYIESDTQRRKEMFVEMNTSKSIDKSTYNLLKGNESLSIAAKELIGFPVNSRYLIRQLNESDAKNYIGVSVVDAVGSNSKNTISFNMLKNMLCIFALGSSSNVSNERKFEEKYSVGSTDYNFLLKNFKNYLDTIFSEMPPFKEIPGHGSNIPKLRNKYISLTGAGLYIIAHIGHKAFKENIDLKEVAESLSQFDWKREIGSNTYNPLFLGGVLDARGNVSNTRNSISASVEEVLEKLLS